jgi:hypothetical protein
MQIDDAPAPVGGVVSSLETHGQRKGVEPHVAARPGSKPADFHFDAPKL